MKKKYKIILGIIFLVLSLNYLRLRYLEYQAFDDSVGVRYPLIFEDWCVDGFELVNDTNQVVFKIYIDKLENSKQLFEVYYRKNDIVQHVEIDSSSTKHFICYVVHSLAYYVYEKDEIITFFYFMRDKLGGLEPFKLFEVMIYKGDVYTCWGVIPQHPDWDWDVHYEFHENMELKNNSNEVFKIMKNRWNNVVDKYKLNYFEYD